jgi:hypothetical protein
MPYCGVSGLPEVVTDCPTRAERSDLGPAEGDTLGDANHGDSFDPFHSFA